jgi:diguanylate cyclase (GGDEF)-like protein
VWGASKELFNLFQDLTFPLRLCLSAEVQADPWMTLIQDMSESSWGPFSVIPPQDATILIHAHAVEAVFFLWDPHHQDTAFLERVAEEVTVCWLIDKERQLNADGLIPAVQDAFTITELKASGAARRIRWAIERHHYLKQMRRAYATDLQTGLPHEQQLIEHMSHLMALRERHPAPMALLVFRLEGLGRVQSRWGPQATQALRRKLAVRLRSGVRASDVVAALENDCYAVLLATLFTPQDAQWVGQKLLHAIKAPLQWAGHEVMLSVAIGVGAYPEDGDQPQVLLRRVCGLAYSAWAQSSLVEGAGLAHSNIGIHSLDAANDPE